MAFGACGWDGYAGVLYMSAAGCHLNGRGRTRTADADHGQKTAGSAQGTRADAIVVAVERLNGAPVGYIPNSVVNKTGGLGLPRPPPPLVPSMVVPSHPVPSRP